MHCKRIFASLFVLLLIASSAFAAPAINVAYVDIQKALESSRAGSRAQKEYETKIRSAQDRIRAKKSDLEQKQSAYLKQKASLNAEARSKKEEEIVNLEKDLKRSLEDAQDTLQRTNAGLLKDLLGDLRDVVRSVGEEKGYTLILERSGTGVLYADSKIDITNLVVERFDARSK